MSSIEAKREQFRKYLERCGVIDALSKALIKLYEDPNKPDDAVRYVRKYMCEACPDDEQYNRLQAQYEEAHRAIARLESEIDKLKSKIKRTPSEIAMLLREGFRALMDDPDCNSLLKKYLTEEILECLLPLKTLCGSTLLDCVQAGFECHSDPIGVYAVEGECYDLFKDLIDPIVCEYHDEKENSGNAVLQMTNDWGDYNLVQTLDPDEDYITQLRITVSRNMEDYVFVPQLKEEQFVEIEKKVTGFFEGLEGEHKGNYVSLKDLTTEQIDQMYDEGLMFKKGEYPFLSSAGIYRFWDTGRGVFTSISKQFAVFVNEEDHLKIISSRDNGDLGEAYKLLVTGVQLLEQNTPFCKDERYGYLTTSLANVGTGLHVYTTIKIPNLLRQRLELNEILEASALIGEEHPRDEEAMIISNKKTIGPTEYDVIRKYSNGIFDIIKAEKED